MNPELTVLSRLMAFHDWYYNYSDDYSAWTRGQRERDAINAEQQRLIFNALATAEEITALADRYRPKNG
jgi:hypothetical protein